MDSTTTEKPKFNVYRAITEKVVAAIEAGAATFQMPWHSRGHPIGRPRNPVTNKPYRGVNVVALWVEAATRGYTSGSWASYRQWQRIGAAVRKGEHGTTIVFYREREIEVDDPVSSQKENRKMLIARASRVFNVAQLDGWYTPKGVERGAAEINAAAEALVEATGASISFGADQACYYPARDSIVMPYREWFVGTPTSSATEGYYATLFHELVHWTGHATRLARDLHGRFGDEAYAMEELVAELGAAFICADAGVANDPRPDHAAYLSAWLRVLKEDPRALFTVAGRATAAAEYLQSGKTDRASASAPETSAA